MQSVDVGVWLHTGSHTLPLAQAGPAAARWPLQRLDRGRALVTAPCLHGILLLAVLTFFAIGAGHVAGALACCLSCFFLQSLMWWGATYLRGPFCATCKEARHYCSSAVQTGLCLGAK